MVDEWASSKQGFRNKGPTMLREIKNWFSTSHQHPRPRPPRKAVLGLECLESRDMPSWTAVPSTLAWHSSTNVNFNSNAISGTAAITKDEADVYDFVAPRSGKYTFTVGKDADLIDTMAGLFQPNGKRVAGN